MMAEANVLKECESLIAVLPELKAPVVFVSNEVGLGIIPENAMAREFRDLAGSVNQRIAIASNQAWFIAAGLPMALKTAD